VYLRDYCSNLGRNDETLNEESINDYGKEKVDTIEF
jgi:hypothetical protein